LNNDDYVTKKKNKGQITATQNDLNILQDTDLDYRVFNVAGNPFNDSKTSCFHKSIGGYHGAKLRRYQELIDSCFSNGINTKVLNMLNTRYIIAPVEGGGTQVQRNMYAMGNAWFVDSILWVNNANEEISALTNFNPGTTAIVDKKFNKEILQTTTRQDSTASIKLIEYKPNYLKYESVLSIEKLAVFSEIYYPKYWIAKIDGKEMPIERANYVLRAMIIPAGSHIIEFSFVPTSWYTANIVAFISSMLILIFMIFGIFVYTKNVKKRN